MSKLRASIEDIEIKTIYTLSQITELGHTQPILLEQISEESKLGL